MENKIYKEFLTICGCLCDEKHYELMEKSCKRWKISEKELVCACKTIPENYQVKLEGIRNLLRIYVEEWLFLEDLWNQDCVTIYYNVPAAVGGMIWLGKSIKGPSYIGSPDFICMVVLYGIIGKKEKVECHSCRHCAVNMMRMKQWEEHLVAIPDIRWSYGCLCDEAPQVDQMLRLEEKCKHQYFIVRLSKKGNETEYIRNQFVDAFSQIVVDYKLDLEKETYREQKKERFLLAVRIEQIMQMLNQEKRFLIHNADVCLLESLLLTTFRGGLADVNSVALNILTEMKEICKEKKQNQYPRMEQRFAVYYTPVCNPEYSRVFEENGIALLYHTAFKCKGIVARKIDCYEDMAGECLDMLIARSAKEEGDGICKVLNEKKLDGLVLGMFTFDRWLGAKQHLLKRHIEERTGKTVFVYETDFWNQESFAMDRMRIAVETLQGMGENLCELL